MLTILMQPNGFLKTVTEIKTPLMLAAFAIAAIVALFNSFISKGKPALRNTLWLVVVATCVVAITPIVLQTVFDLRLHTVYRVRVNTVDASGIPLNGATVQVTALSERAQTKEGTCEFAIPSATLPKEKRITIYAMKDNLHGEQEMTLTNDMNPAVTIKMYAIQTSGIHGLVEDEDRHALPGVHINIPGLPAAVSDAEGNFAFTPFTAPGTQVRIHAEKAGFVSEDFYQTVSDQTVTIVMQADKRHGR